MITEKINDLGETVYSWLFTYTSSVKNSNEIRKDYEEHARRLKPEVSAVFIKILQMAEGFFIPTYVGQARGNISFIPENLDLQREMSAPAGERFGERIISIDEIQKILNEHMTNPEWNYYELTAFGRTKLWLKDSNDKPIEEWVSPSWMTWSGIVNPIFHNSAIEIMVSYEETDTDDFVIEILISTTTDIWYNTKSDSDIIDSNREIGTLNRDKLLALLHNIKNTFPIETIKEYADTFWEHKQPKITLLE